MILLFFLACVFLSISAQPFYAVQDLNIEFHALNDLLSINRHKLLSQEQPDVASIHKLLRAECLYQYLLTNERSQQCLASHQFQSGQTTLKTAQASTTSLNPLLLPLYDHQTNLHNPSQESMHTLSVEQREEEQKQKELFEKFVTTSTLAPFGESISLSFVLTLPESESANAQLQETQSTNQPFVTSQSIQTSTLFDFQLNLSSAGITLQTRIKIVDNSLTKNTTEALINDNLDKTEEHFPEHITNIYGTIGSTYSGKIMQNDGSFSTLTFTIIERSKFEGILFHNGVIYSIQPPELVIPTYINIQQHNQAQTIKIMNDGGIGVDDLNGINGNGNDNSIDYLGFLNKALEMSSTSLNTNMYDIDQDFATADIDSASASASASEDKNEPYYNLFHYLDYLFTPLESPQFNTLSPSVFIQDNDISLISSLFFSNTPLKDLLKQTTSQSSPTSTLSTLQILQQNQAKFIATSTEHFGNPFKENLKKIWSCQVLDPETNQIIEESTDAHSFSEFEHSSQSEGMFSQKPQLTRWPNCLKEADNTYMSGDNRFHIGFVVDNGAYIAAGKNIGNVVARIQSAIAWGNNFYPHQLGLHFTIDHILIMTSYQTNDPSWNNDGNQKNISTNQLLSNLVSYRKTKHPNDFAILSLMTNLFPPPGVVGLAYLSSVGVGKAASWATLSNFYFLTCIHELSHNTAASHTFGANQGSIMSYDLSGRIGSVDPPNQGQVGLNRVTTSGEVCGYLSQVRRGTQTADGNIRVPFDKIFSKYDGPICGNGLLEKGEECDAGKNNGVASPKGKICCTSDCKLTSGSTCAPNKINGVLSTVAENSECCNECEAQKMSTRCGALRSTGYCGRDGICVVSGCNAMNGIIPCDAAYYNELNPCLQQCSAMNQTDKSKCYPLSYETPHIYAQHGSHCVYTNGTNGICIYDNFPTPEDQFSQRPIPGENFIQLSQIPRCVPSTYQLTVIDDHKMNPCGCDGYSTFLLSCLENNMNYLNKEKCIFELNQWYPPHSFVRCTPPPYCKI